MALSIGDHAVQSLEVRSQGAECVRFFVSVRVVKEKSVVMHFISAAFRPDVDLNCGRPAKTTERKRKRQSYGGLVSHRTGLCWLRIVLALHSLGNTYISPAYVFINLLLYSCGLWLCVYSCVVRAKEHTFCFS